MTPENFCYWLQGFFEIANPKELSPEEVQKVKDHLKLVFEKLTPDRDQQPDTQITREMLRHFYKGVDIPLGPQPYIVRDNTNGYALPPNVTISC